MWFPWIRDWEWVGRTRYVDSPAERLWPFLIGGLVGPMVLVGLGLRWIARESAGWPSRFGGWHEFHGSAAVTLGVAALGMAVFLHAHYGWGHVERGVWVRQLAEGLGGLVFVVSMGYAMWEGFVTLWA